MRESLKQKIIQVCQQKIGQKGEGVGVSFYPRFRSQFRNKLLHTEHQEA